MLIETSGMGDPDHIKIFFSGDVMTGRGIDQILPHPSPPQIHEGFMKSALGYVSIAEEVNGPIPRPADYSYIWGDALEELELMAPDIRMINLETAVTKSEDWEDKGINYRMNPKNVRCLTVAGIDCCTLANNHVLDWGAEGLRETIDSLRRAGIKTTGAGKDLDEALTPAELYVRRNCRVLVYAFGARSSGIPSRWAAASNRPGVNFLADLSDRTVADITKTVSGTRREGDIVIVSVHWGGNWGYDVSDQERHFARKLVTEAGFDMFIGHSSHHAKGTEVHNGRLILYGCGDLLNDYEGISGFESFRGDLGLMYFATMSRSSGGLVSLTMTPVQMKRFSIIRAGEADALWLAGMLNREGESFGTGAEPDSNGRLVLTW